MTDELRFDGQVAVITGAGRGLGRAYALALAERGAKVVVNNRTGTVPGEDPAADVVDAIRGAGGEATVCHGSVELRETADAIVRTALDTYGRLDVVVANAGAVLELGPFAERTIDQLDLMLDVHLRGTYHLLQAAWPHLVAQDYGRVVLTGSAAGFYGHPGGIEYAAAKGAIMGLFQSLSLETQRTGIRLNLISPAGMTGPNERLPYDEDTKAFLRTFLDPALVSPVLAVLAHERCPFNGRMFSAGGGHAGRIEISESAGFWPDASTPEAYLAGADRMDAMTEPTQHEDAMQWGAWIGGLAAERSVVARRQEG